ncbi:MAG TPA: hypothetical protein VHM19_07750, partial [Polyangiales bacterium]|nr:hypothetical protein [Polyangiales bacterium]
SPKHKVAHFAMARIALEQRKVHKAERCLRGIVDGGSDGYLLRLMLSRAALARDDAAGAQRELEAAAKLDPDREDAWKSLVEVAQRSGDTAAVERAIERLAQIDQHDRSIHEAYALLLAKRQRWAELVREGENALYVAPDSPVIHHALGRAYLETGNAKQALVELDRALALSPPKPEEIQQERARAQRALKTGELLP